MIPSFPKLSAADVEIAGLLYAAERLLGLYEVNARRYLAVPDLETWYDYQSYIRGTKRKAEGDKSRLPPPPPEAFQTNSAQLRALARDVAQSSAFAHQNSAQCPYTFTFKEEAKSSLQLFSTPQVVPGELFGPVGPSPESSAGESKAEKPLNGHGQVFAVFDGHQLPRPDRGKVACWLRDLGLDGTLSLLAELGREGLGHGETFVTGAVVKRMNGFRGKNTVQIGPTVTQAEADDFDARVMARGRAAAGGNT
jgi:hypothetical protein